MQKIKKISNHKTKHRDDFYFILKEQLESYPKIEICDAIKLIFQSEFGGGHKVDDQHNCMMKINELGSNLTTEQLMVPYYEEIGGGFARMNMSVLGAIPVELLGRMFMASIKENRGTNRGFEEKINILRELCFEGETEFTVDALNKYLEEYRKEPYHPVSHSDTYINEYQPAYRVVKTEFCHYLDVFIKISRLYSSGSQVSVGIDGPSYSGKTQLAKLISTVFDCNTFDTRDFIISGGGLIKYHSSLSYVDTERIKNEVLVKLDSGLPYSVGIYDEELDKVKKRVAIVPKRLNIVKGAYALHPKLNKYYDLKIFVDTSAEEQTKLIVQSDKLKLNLKNEAYLCDYFEKNNIKLICDLYYENNLKYNKKESIPV